MKRDWNLIREILLEVEELEPTHALDLGQELDPVKVTHQLLLIDSGFLSAKVEFAEGGKEYGLIYGMTWDGYELLSSIRDDSIWSKVKDRLTKVGGQVTIEVLKVLASTIVKQTLEIN